MITAKKQYLIIGESFNPINHGDADSWDNAFTKLKTSGKTILDWFDLSHEEMWKTFDSLNIKNRDNKFISNDLLLEMISDHQMSFVFGRIAERYVFNEIKTILPYQEVINNHIVFILPHPSGRNRKLNDKTLLNNCKQVCRSAIKDYINEKE